MLEGGHVLRLDKNKDETDRNTGKFTWAQVIKWKSCDFQVYITTIKGEALEHLTRSGTGDEQEESLMEGAIRDSTVRVLSRTQTNLQLMLLSWLPPCMSPSPPPLQSYRFSWKALKWGLECRGREDSAPFWASARFSLGPGHVSQCWFPWLIYPKSALPETLAFVLPVAVSKWGFGWEQYQRDRHYTPIMMKLMASKSFWLKALTGWDHTGL